MPNHYVRSSSILLGMVILCSAANAAAPTANALRTINIAGIGAKSGLLRQFGLNSEAALQAAVEQINATGGVKLGDGSRAKLAVDYFDDRCNVDDGIASIRKIASGPWLAAIGTTCSSVTEQIFGTLQKHAGDAGESGLRIPVFTDVAMKLGMTKSSDWAFRNIPEEVVMYDTTFAWLKKKYPDVKTVFGGVEENFVHSNQTWYAVIKKSASNAGFDVRGETRWLIEDTSFVEQVRDMKAQNADLVVISAHPATACGVLREMKRQHVTPRFLVGLTSSSTPETLEACGAAAQGMLIPTSYAPVTPKAVAAAKATARFNGYADLHSMAAWENVMAIKQVIESQSVLARSDTVQADREKIRLGLSKLTAIDGLMGTVGRTPERESVKPYVILEARNGTWEVALVPDRAPGQSRQ